MILPNAIKTAMNILEASGFECFAVGGCVRDCVMGRTPGDYDLTTNALPHEMTECFKNYRIIETGIKHGTVTVVIDEYNVEITTYRIDGEYKDNRRPESVMFTSELSEDLSRRDFTVNAMAYSEGCGLVDLFGGCEDIKNRIIRCVGDSDKRFCEDGLRILRALRFASVLDFEIEKNTADSILRQKNLLKNISRERIFAELTKLVCGVGAERVIGGFTGIFDVCLGERVHFDGISKVEPSVYARYAVLLSDVADPKGVMRSLRADNKTTDSVSKVCCRAKESFCELSDVKRLVRDIGVQNAYVLAEMKRAFDDFDKCDGLKKNIEIAEKACCTIKQLEISGDDVTSFGISGTSVGKVLNCVLDSVIDNEIENKRDKLLCFVKSMLDNWTIV